MGEAQEKIEIQMLRLKIKVKEIQNKRKKYVEKIERLTGVKITTRIIPHYIENYHLIQKNSQCRNENEKNCSKRKKECANKSKKKSKMRNDYLLLDCDEASNSNRIELQIEVTQA